MRRIFAIVVAVFAVFTGSGSALAQCMFSNFSPVPASTPFSVGPTIYWSAMTMPGVTQAVLGGRDAWDRTDAANRIGDWNGAVTASDCPFGQPSQLGAFNFRTVYCPTVIAYQAWDALSFVDYFPEMCAGCGTKSVSLNLAYPFAVNPLPGQYDIQSVFAHEFGHVLGFRHMVANTCTEDIGPACAADPNRATMGRGIYSGDTCLRDVSSYDVTNANGLY